MTWLRHYPRHVHRTLFNHLEAELDGLGWTDALATPFGAPVVTLVDAPMVDGDQIRKQAAPGKVFVTLGDEDPPDAEELGGPLSMQRVPIFVDAFMDAHGHAVALASDIRDIFLGRIGGKRVLPVVDQGTGVAVPGWSMEFCDVQRETPPLNLALHWQVVKVTCEVTYPEEVY